MLGWRGWCWSTCQGSGAQPSRVRGFLSEHTHCLRFMRFFSPVHTRHELSCVACSNLCSLICLALSSLSTSRVNVLLQLPWPVGIKLRFHHDCVYDVYASASCHAASKKEKSYRPRELTMVLHSWIERRQVPYASLEEKKMEAESLSISVARVTNCCKHFRKRYVKVGARLTSYRTLVSAAQ